MIRRALQETVCSLGIISLLFVTAHAQQAKDGVVILNGGRNAIYTKAPSQIATPSVPSNSKLVKIYSNLGTGNNVYNGVAGYGILGPDAGQPWPQAVACGFKPKANHLVTEIDLGITYVQGTKVAVVSLNENSKGIPGKALHTWTFKNLPDFGTCCKLQVAKYAKGIPVKKGKMYWVMVSPNKKYTDTYDVWNNDASGEQGPFSNNIGSGWNSSIQQLTGFGVFGK